MEEAEKPKANGNKRKADNSTDADTSKKAKVEQGASATCFVGNLSWNVDEDTLRQEFEGIGTILSVKLLTDKMTGKPKGLGFVDFSSPAEAAEAVSKLNGHEIDGRAIRVDIAQPRENNDTRGGARGGRGAARGGRGASNSREERTPNAPGKTLWLGNLSYSTNEDSLYEAFEEYGVKHVRLPTDQETGKPKGFAYVEFGSTDEASAAFGAMNGQDIGGRTVKMDYAPERNTGGFCHTI
ncbi:RNA-binding domain-containing protein [Gonapodya prolifera JEL478]|uniref:RNA-binding domain-containing protein n=1 Tax=Gonapodya prolifera (strain JEL478) TaxID=1344416 RepID=A0A139AVA8_GONPJ|nr:RNA-binding domain-containing protein [Gonapodya prolifera JEL478]|eukprot:KXS20671.1 RNA-binding domain-containing protein [Gonapodya prolifera JEL478]